MFIGRSSVDRGKITSTNTTAPFVGKRQQRPRSTPLKATLKTYRGAI
jgi:hypothetical protein